MDLGFARCGLAGSLPVPARHGPAAGAQRTREAARRGRRADERAELHEGLVVIAGAASRRSASTRSCRWRRIRGGEPSGRPRIREPARTRATLPSTTGARSPNAIDATAAPCRPDRRAARASLRASAGSLPPERQRSRAPRAEDCARARSSRGRPTRRGRSSPAPARAHDRREASHEARPSTGRRPDASSAAA